MKRILTLALVVSATAFANAQGTVNFANLAGGVNAAIFDVGHSTALSGANGFVAQLYGGTNGTPIGSLVKMGNPVAFLTGGSAGYFLGGETAVTNVLGGQIATLLVRVWDTDNGATFEAASQVVGAHIGESGTVNVTLSPGAPSPVPPMTGLLGFDLIAVVPEPSTVTLGLLGVAALFFRRRKQA